MKINQDLSICVQSAVLGCVTPSMRMIKAILSEKEKIIYVVVYFDRIPKIYESELVSDISSEIECSLINPVFVCESICVFSSCSVFDNVRVSEFEKELCPTMSFSVMAYLRYGENDDFDLESDANNELGSDDFFILD